MPFRSSTTLTALATTALLALPGAARAVTPEVYPMPTGVAAEAGLTTDAAGDVWFTASDLFSPTPRIGKLAVAEASTSTPTGYKLYPTPTYAGAPNLAILRSLDYDPIKGSVWFSRSDGVYGFAKVSAVNEGTSAGISFGRTPGGVNVQTVAVDRGTGAVWLTEHGASNTTPAGKPAGYFSGNRVALTDEGLGLSEGPNIAQQGGESTLVSARYDAKPYGIVPDGTGGAWFTEANPGLPGYRIAHTSAGGGGYAEYLITPCVSASPCSGSNTGTGPTAITKGPDGSLWFINELTSTVSRLDAGATTFTHYPLGTIDASLGGARPMAIKAAADGTIWVTTRGASFNNTAANAIIRLVPSTTGGPLTADIYKTGTSAPLSLTIDSATGDVWTAANPNAGGAGTLVRIAGTAPAPKPGAETPAPAPSPAPGAVVVKPGVPGVAKVSPPGADSVRVTQICVGPPQDKCSLVYLLDSHEYVTGFPGTKESLSYGAAPKKKPKTPKKPKRPKTVELGRAAVTVNGGQTADVQVRLSKKARALLAKKKKLRVTLRVMEQQPDGTLKKVSSKELTFKAKKKKKP